MNKKILSLFALFIMPFILQFLAGCLTLDDCQSITDQESREKCILYWSYKYANDNYCNDSYFIDQTKERVVTTCYYKAATGMALQNKSNITKTIETCEKINMSRNFYKWETCIFDIARLYNNKSICSRALRPYVLAGVYSNKSLRLCEYYTDYDVRETDHPSYTACPLATIIILSTFALAYLKK